MGLTKADLRALRSKLRQQPLSGATSATTASGEDRGVMWETGDD
jgi:hypothetical protein